MAAAAPDKIIVSNLKRLTAKYGAAGVKKVAAAVKKLIAADAGRGVVSAMVDLSDTKSMAKYGAKAVSNGSAGDAKANKRAIDKVFQHGSVRPSYLMLLGSTDVIPHVPLINPLFGDGDPDLPSDLPYACDQPYSTDVQGFLAPTRVVGRLPNVTGDNDAGYLVRLLETAANHTSRPPGEYNGFLGISAEVWKKSSEKSLKAILGFHAGMKVSPSDGYKWTAAVAKPRVHFVNCHGAPVDGDFYGQSGNSFPVAHSAAWMANKVVEGTIMAAECCFGAELYDPALATSQGRMAMCNTYLGRQAYAYFGSTNTAYGPASTNDMADLICRYFLRRILAGASAGRACLQARLDYVQGKGGTLTPTDHKTLGQFNLMADPSLTPVAAPTPHTVILAAKGKKLPAATTAVERHGRLGRRASLVARAAATTVYRLSTAKFGPGGKSAAFGKVRKLAAEMGITAPDVFISQSVGSASNMAGAKGFGFTPEVAGPAPKAVHVVLERLPSPREVPHLRLVRGVEAVEYQDGMVVTAFES